MGQPLVTNLSEQQECYFSEGLEQRFRAEIRHNLLRTQPKKTQIFFARAYGARDCFCTVWPLPRDLTALLRVSAFGAPSCWMQIRPVQRIGAYFVKNAFGGLEILAVTQCGQLC